jgi:hypothetical protein
MQVAAKAGLTVYTKFETITSYNCFMIVGDTPALLTDSKDDMYKLSEEVHTFAFDVVFGQLKGSLTNLSNMEVST